MERVPKTLEEKSRKGRAQKGPAAKWRLGVTLAGNGGGDDNIFPRENTVTQGRFFACVFAWPLMGNVSDQRLSVGRLFDRV